MGTDEGVYTAIRVVRLNSETAAVQVSASWLYPSVVSDYLKRADIVCCTPCSAIIILPTAICSPE